MPKRAELRLVRAYLNTERDNLRPKSADFQLKTTDLRSERLDLWPDRIDLRLKRADFRPDLGLRGLICSLRGMI